MHSHFFLFLPATIATCPGPLCQQLLQKISTAIDIQRPARRIHRPVVEGVDKVHEMIHVRSVLGEDMDVVVDQRMALAQGQRRMKMAGIEDHQGMFLRHMRHSVPFTRSNAVVRRAAARAIAAARRSTDARARPLRRSRAARARSQAHPENPAIHCDDSHEGKPSDPRRFRQMEPSAAKRFAAPIVPAHFQRGSKQRRCARRADQIDALRRSGIGGRGRFDDAVCAVRQRRRRRPGLRFPCCVPGVVVAKPMTSAGSPASDSTHPAYGLPGSSVHRHRRAPRTAARLVVIALRAP